MHALELPHSAGCLVCGRSNPHGLKLRLHVLPESGLVSTEFIPRPEHIGFEGVVHGGLLATVLDEAMTWAATWKNKRFCLCAELTARLRYPVRPGEALRVEALVEFSRPKLVEVASKIFDFTGRLCATGSGKYMPTTPEQHRDYLRAFLPDPLTAKAAAMLAGEAPQSESAEPKIEVTLHVDSTAPAKEQHAESGSLDDRIAPA